LSATPEFIVVPLAVRSDCKSNATAKMGCLQQLDAEILFWDGICSLITRIEWDSSASIGKNVPSELAGWRNYLTDNFIAASSLQ